MINKRKHLLTCMLALIMLLTAGCGNAVEATALEEETKEEQSIDENQLLYVTELDYTTIPTDPEYIELSEIEGNLVIEDGGEYVLSGTTHYTIKIDVHDEIIHLFFNGLTIETADGPAIEVISASKVIITLMEDSGNAIFDAAYYSNEEITGAISSACDLTINGLGSLYICGYYKDAIYTKDVLKILGGSIQIRAKRNGIKGNDGILLSTDTLIIESEKNGCITTNADKEDKGVIDIQGGEISIVAGKYGLSAASDVYVREGQVYLNCVIGNIYTEGQQYIAEGTVIDE